MSRWKNELTRCGTALLAAVALTVAACSQAIAQAQDDFSSISEITREQLPAVPLVYVAYALVWIALIVYVFMLWQRLNRVERELKDVSAKLAGGKRA